MVKIFTILILTLVPLSSVLAQAKMQSSNHILTDINFGSNFVIQTTTNDPPTISSQGPQVTELLPAQVTIEWTTNKNGNSFVEYGKTTNYGQESGSSEQSKTHKVILYGLSPETTYNYRVKSTDTFGAIGTSSNKTFTTPAEAGINTVKISDVTYDKALISWKTGDYTSSNIDYGTTTKYGTTKTVSSKSFTTDHTVQLTDLSAGTDYHFRIAAKNENGDTQHSSDISFTTKAKPQITAISVTHPDANIASITVETNTSTTLIVSYKSDKDAKALSGGDAALATKHALLITKLYGNTKYTYEIQATDDAGSQVKSGEKTFTTPSDSTAPTISNIKVEVTRTDNRESMFRVSFDTSEPSIGKVVYSPKNNLADTNSAKGSSELITEHAIAATGLSPSTPYRAEIEVTDFSGNSAKQAVSFISASTRRSIFQWIADNASKAFGWLNRLFGD